MSENLRRLEYVWEAPVRFFHWINFLCLLALTITGFLIADPPALQGSGQAWQGYWFGWVRFIHFATAYLFLLNLVYRVYWAFVGNRYARWWNFVPLRAAQWVEMWEVAKRYALVLPNRAGRPVGHNPLAATSYLVIVLLMVFQAVSGFGLYAAMSDAWFPQLFVWIVPLLGGDMVVRQWHHLAMWAFIVFTVFHVYLSWFNDDRERQGIFTSIFTGFKFVEKD